MRVEPTSPHSPLAEELARCLRVLERRAEYAPADVDTYLVALVRRCAAEVPAKDARNQRLKAENTALTTRCDLCGGLTPFQGPSHLCAAPPEYVLVPTLTYWLDGAGLHMKVEAQRRPAAFVYDQQTVLTIPWSELRTAQRVLASTGDDQQKG